MIAQALSWFTYLAGAALIAAGSILILIAAVGVLRMPDVYTRMHAAGITDSCGAFLILGGFACYAGLSVVTFKLFIIGALLFFSGPVATHALANAALHAGVVPKLFADRRRQFEEHEQLNEAAQ
jgi:multicomponent Na+:H+ antiporter subunit G